MKLQEFSAVDDGEQIKRVAFVMSDHPDPAKRTGWINAQIAVDLPIVRNGALLRAEVLQQARDTLDAVAKDYERLGRRER